MTDLNQNFIRVLNTPGDINEHLHYLFNLSLDCESILECGVRNVVSSWAFLKGLVENTSTNVKSLTCCDLKRDPSIDTINTVCKENNLSFMFHEESDLTIPMKEYDMIFIDTWHIYGHLKRELEKMHSYAKKYIAMHDTEIDKIYGETIRCGWNSKQQSIESGYPEEEIVCGLQKAIDEFLVSHPEWRIKDHFTHNNGLTVLERV